MRLINFDSIPRWYGDNRYIISGYRAPNPSILYCIRSLFVLHNESGNIFTHMAGALLFSIQWYHTIGCQRNKSYTADDTLVMNGMFGLCVNFHHYLMYTYYDYNHRLDYLGIALVLNMAQISWLYYGFYDDLMVRKVYISISLLLGGVLISVTLLDRFSESYFRRYRAIIFLSKGLYGNS
ncbi:unnamed protein product [Oppiella nova]|uniref:Uncharacterized protein n=1 Tax=Oppiella nova TaxID=334625 RepID=A0A7R9M864_9ACAR|nr:unnamed protein product [Oppiella nova]CAG2172589.1 unnamed protein product [Oppiella nova]